jgi:mono/diheme cytochrome c family protein
MRPELKFTHALAFAIRYAAGVFLIAFLFAISVFFAQASTLSQSAGEGETIFRQKCSSCHTIGGGQLVGPDLQEVTQRRDLAWIKSFIAGPDKMIASGDPTAVQLLQENNNITMPALGMQPAEIDLIVAYLENPAAAPAAGAPPPAQAVNLPAGNAAAGMQLFTGTQALQNGGPSCIACHTVGGSTALGGGTLGPDLTHVFQRYGDAGLASALQNIAFPTMVGVFAGTPLTNDEVANLHAYFKWADQGATVTKPATGWFLGIGALGAIALFGVMAIFWPRQRQSLSEKLRRGGNTGDRSGR